VMRFFEVTWSRSIGEISQIKHPTQREWVSYPR